MDLDKNDENCQDVVWIAKLPSQKIDYLQCLRVLPEEERCFENESDDN